jgi:hypothetical protein
MEPASTIIDRIGGEAVVADVTGVAYTAPYRWKYPKDRGGTGGIIPHWHVPKLIAYAREKGIELSEADFAPRPAPAEAEARVA